MIIKPNEKYIGKKPENDVENDLYRKFHKIYSEILHPDNNTYDTDTYCLTKNNLENSLSQILNNSSDGIIPLLGYVGMGKTFLMHYCIRVRYNYYEIIKNKSFVGKFGKHNDLIIYASYDASRKREATKGRLGGKLGDAGDTLLDFLKNQHKELNDSDYIFNEVIKYIEENKRELLEEYSKSPNDTKEDKGNLLYANDRIAYEAERIKWILTSYDTGIKNVIIVLDDIEGYKGELGSLYHEYDLIDDYESIYDCLRRHSHKKNTFNIKLFMCMREKTYNEICTSSWFTAHRTRRDPLKISSGINLSEMFMKKFKYIEKKKKVLDYVENIESWEDAKTHLKDLSDELERMMGNSILEICNYNVSDAVQLFAGILSNRQWTQRNEKVAPSFKIEKYRYYLSPASVFKAMAMRNNVVFCNECQISNLFYKNSIVGYSLPIYILLLLRGTNENDHEFTISQIEEIIIEVLDLKESETINRKKNHIKEIIGYYIRKEIIFQKNTIAANAKENILKIYLSPKGKVLLDYFLDNTILLELYRDDLFLDSNRHDIRCSAHMTSIEMFEDIIGIIDEIGEDEVKFLSTISNTDTWNEFYSVWEKISVTLRLIEALKHTFNNYYKNWGTPEQLIDAYNNIKNKYQNIFDEIYY